MFISRVQNQGFRPKRAKTLVLYSSNIDLSYQNTGLIYRFEYQRVECMSYYFLLILSLGRCTPVLHFYIYMETPQNNPKLSYIRFHTSKNMFSYMKCLKSTCSMINVKDFFPHSQSRKLFWHSTREWHKETDFISENSISWTQQSVNYRKLGGTHDTKWERRWMSKPKITDQNSQGGIALLYIYFP